MSTAQAPGGASGVGSEAPRPYDIRSFWDMLPLMFPDDHFSALSSPQRREQREAVAATSSIAFTQLAMQTSRSRK